jgi:hypothetical protein
VQHEKIHIKFIAIPLCLFSFVLELALLCFAFLNVIPPQFRCVPILQGTTEEGVTIEPNSGSLAGWCRERATQQTIKRTNIQQSSFRSSTCHANAARVSVINCHG